MTTITAFLAAMLLAGFQDPPASQDGEGDAPARRPRQTQERVERAQDPERQAEQRARFLKDQLGLTDEQVQKATEIYKQSREAEQKLEADRQAKLRELLTDEQKKKYDDMIANPGRNVPRPGGAFLGGFDRMIEGWAETIKKELALEDAPFEKVKALIEEFRKKIQERAEKLRAEGFQGMNWQEEMQKFQDGVKEVGEKIKEHLTPEQKEKFDKLLERLQPGRNFGGNNERRGPPTAEERATRALEALKIADAGEQSAVKAALLKVYESQNALGETDREMRPKIEEIHKDGSLTDEQITAKLNELRAARLEKDKAHKAAQSALREIISPRQEVELIRLGALR